MLFYELKNNEQMDEFIEWLEFSSHSFPISFYLNGITYTLADQDWTDCFTIGFKAARQIEGERFRSE